MKVQPRDGHVRDLRAVLFAEGPELRAPLVRRITEHAYKAGAGLVTTEGGAVYPQLETKL